MLELPAAGSLSSKFYLRGQKVRVLGHVSDKMALTARKLSSICGLRWLNLPVTSKTRGMFRFRMLNTSMAALFYSPVDSPMHQTCIRVMHV